MAEFLTKDINLLVSATPEQAGVGGGYNVFKTAGSDFIRAYMRGRGFGIPTLDKIDNVDLVGTGFEFATQLRPNYWTHPVMTVGEDANVDMAALFLAWALGGVNAAPSTIGGVGSTAREHILLMQTNSQGRQLQSRNLITSVGYVDDSNPGADFLFGGVVPDTFTLSQTRADTPTWSTDLVGSGRFVTPLPTGVRTGLPGVVEQRYVHGAAVVVTYDDGTAINLSVDGRVRGWTFTFNNNLRRDDRRPGDPFRVPDDPSSGAYVNRLLRGPRTAGATITVSLHQDLREFLTHSQNRIINNLSFLMKGNIIAGVTPTTNYLLEVKMPRSYLRGITAADDGDDAALTLDFFPVKGSGEYVSARVINERTTAYA